MAWKETSIPAALAVNLEDLKNHLRVLSNKEDTLLQLYAEAAVRIAELRTRRALISRTVVYEEDCFPQGGCFIELPVSPMTGTATVQYYDTAETLQTVSAADYHVDQTSLLPRIGLNTGAVWPPTQRRAGAVRITFTAGYGVDAASVPAGLRIAILMLAAHFYENRVPVEVGAGTVAEIPLTLAFALDTYKIASH